MSCLSDFQRALTAPPRQRAHPDSVRAEVGSTADLDIPRGSRHSSIDLLSLQEPPLQNRIQSVCRLLVRVRILCRRTSLRWRSASCEGLGSLPGPVWGRPGRSPGALEAAEEPCQRERRCILWPRLHHMPLQPTASSARHRGLRKPPAHMPTLYPQPHSRGGACRKRSPHRGLSAGRDASSRSGRHRSSASGPKVSGATGPARERAVRFRSTALRHRRAKGGRAMRVLSGWATGLAERIHFEVHPFDPMSMVILTLLRSICAPHHAKRMCIARRMERYFGIRQLPACALSPTCPPCHGPNPPAHASSQPPAQRRSANSASGIETVVLGGIPGCQAVPQCFCCCRRPLRAPRRLGRLFALVAQPSASPARRFVVSFVQHRAVGLATARAEAVAPRCD